VARRKPSPFLWIALAGGAVFLYMRFRKKKTATERAVDTVMWDVEIGPATVKIL